MFQWMFLFVLVVVGYCQSHSDGIVSVKLSNGNEVRGRELKTLYANRSYFSFKGIPYAEPPVGELRFKAPVPSTRAGIIDALEYGSVCLQMGIPGSEDCLFLNVFTPDVKSTSKKAVIVFLHGGSFNEGSGNDEFYGPDFLIEEDVILVTLNYRLGLFGFLSLGTAEYSGNMGLKDQQMAFRWVNEHIEHFGGDTNRITIYGQSAGGASVQFHVMMESSAGLFKRAIVSSGSAGNFWALSPNTNHLVEMFELARKYEPETSTYPELIEWLKETPVSNFMDNIDPRVDICIWESYLEFSFGPKVEDRSYDQPFLLQEYLFSEAKTIRNIDVMFGFTAAEWVFAMGPKLANHSKLEYLKEKFDIILPFTDFAEYRDTDLYATMLDEIKTYYFGKDATLNVETYPEFVQVISDVAVVYGTTKGADKHATLSKGKTYFYRLSADTGINGYKIWSNTTSLKGAAHCDDLCYIFRCNVVPNLYDFAEDSTERVAQRKMLKLWSNFAKFGNPTKEGTEVILKPYTVAERNFVDIRANGLVTDLGANQQQIQFWDDLREKYTELFGKTYNRKEEL